MMIADNTPNLQAGAVFPLQSILQSILKRVQGPDRNSAVEIAYTDLARRMNTKHQTR